MTQLQSKLVEMLAWFHRFCEENQLTYYAVGGTALGAVRHNGFIPWDDDIDVGMPREDYEKFLKLMERSTGTRYVTEVFTGNKEYLYPFCKLYDTETTLIENRRYKAKRGIYLDIFPIDGAGNTREEAQKTVKLIQKPMSLLLLKTMALRKERSWYKNFFIAGSRFFIDVFYSNKFLIGNIVKICKKRAYSDSKYVANLVGAWGEKEIVEKQWLGTPKLLDFENIKICCPENTDLYLGSLYGNYMQLPPEEKRVSHHNRILLDLNKSYKKD